MDTHTHTGVGGETQRECVMVDYCNQSYRLGSFTCLITGMNNFENWSKIYNSLVCVFVCITREGAYVCVFMWRPEGNPKYHSFIIIIHLKYERAHMSVVPAGATRGH